MEGEKKTDIPYPPHIKPNKKWGAWEGGKEEEHEGKTECINLAVRKTGCLPSR